MILLIAKSVSMLYLIPMNTDFTIRRMELSDIDDLIALGAAIEWKMIPENWLLTLEPFPEHCFVAIADGKLAGSAVSCCYDGKHAVVSKVIVEKSCRRRGIAMNLMQRVMASYPRGTSFLLDSSPYGIELYRKLGFSEMEFPRIRKLRTFDFQLCPEDKAELAIPLEKTDLQEISALDFQVSRMDRSRILKKYFDAAPELAFKVVNESKITGFCLGNRSGICREICPLIADGTVAAKTLFLKSVMADENHGIIVDIPACHAELISFLESRSMTLLMELVRMKKGNTPFYVPQHYFSLLGSNLG